MSRGIVLDPTVGGAGSTLSDDHPGASHGLGNLTGRGPRHPRGRALALVGLGGRRVAPRPRGRGGTGRVLALRRQPCRQGGSTGRSGAADISRRGRRRRLGPRQLRILHHVDRARRAGRDRPGAAVGGRGHRAVPGLGTGPHRGGGHPELPLQILPYPLETRDEADVRAIARSAYHNLLAAFGIAR